MSNFTTNPQLLPTLLDNIAAGKIQLPDFQRGWVWKDDGIRSLLVSIARAFPIGAIMMLETGGDTHFQVRPVEGLDPANIPPQQASQLILDGQQRLTSLTQALMLNQPVATRTATGKPLKRYYYINIELALEGPEYYEDAFLGVDANRLIKTNFGKEIKLDLSTPEKEYENLYFPCNRMFDRNQWEMGFATFNQTKFFRYMEFREQVLTEFQNYSIPVITLSNNNKKEAVCLIFEKVNTGGVALSVFELITATYAADGTNLRDEWFGNPQQNIQGIHQRMCSEERLLRRIEPTEFFQGLSLLHTWDKRQKDLTEGKTGKQVTGVSAKRDAVLSLPLSAYQTWKDKLTAGFITAAKFLRKESFFTTHDLPYGTQLVPLAAVLTLLGDAWLQPLIYDKLARWFWCGVLGELYGSTTETRFALDIQGLMDWIRGQAGEPATIRDANFQPARLDTLRSRNSAAYKGIHVLVMREGARDFFWKTTIRELSVKDWHEYRLDIHHVFPKQWCKAQGIPSSRYNSILNKTPISYKANRMIGGKAPSEYLQQLQTHEHVQLDDADMDAILATHSINPHTLRVNDFDAFMHDRRQQLLKKIEAAMGKSIVVSDEPVAEDLDDEPADVDMDLA